MGGQGIAPMDIPRGCNGGPVVADPHPPLPPPPLRAARGAQGQLTQPCPVRQRSPPTRRSPSGPGGRCWGSSTPCGIHGPCWYQAQVCLPSSPLSWRSSHTVLRGRGTAGL
jgi:hypothetical protein